MIKKYLEKFNSIITDSHELSKLNFRVVYATFMGIAFVMSILNILTDQYVLLAFTAGFTFCCLICYILAFQSDRAVRFASILFIFATIVLFTYFIITGGTDKFSILWVLLLPTIGISFFGFKKGTILCTVIFFVIISTFYIPFLRAFCVDYGDTFRLRFPLIYLGCYVTSLFLEYIRFITARELDRVKENYEHLYKHDQLTGLYNRYEMERSYIFPEPPKSGTYALLSFDIDFFKKINDTYGHMAGDEVLEFLGKTVRETIPENAKAFRTGGEEFSVLYYDGENALENAELLRQKISEHKFIFNGSTVTVTISLGLSMVTYSKILPPFDMIFAATDNLLYEAKAFGRNCLKVSEYK